jgi:predicted ester cyclase
MSGNKEIVRRFNLEIIQNGNLDVFDELVSPDFLNHSAAPGASRGPEGFLAFFTDILHPAFSGIQVEIHDQIEEDAKVATRKTISGTHTGTFLGHPPTGRRIAIRVTDIIRIEGGRYAEHWGSADIQGALAQMKAGA